MPRLVICLLVAVVALTSACGNASEPGGREDSAVVVEHTNAIKGYGMRIELPSGWDGRVYLADAVLPVVQAANFPLPPVTNDYPTDPPLREQADGSIYIAFFDVADPAPERRRWVRDEPPLRIDRSHFATPEGSDPPPDGSALARRFLVINERAYVLRVAFGTADPSDALLDEANGVLSLLSVKMWRPPDCPPNWPGPWTACPEADWVRQVTERAGYRVVDETGSALVGRGGGRGFYIHATETTAKAVEQMAKRDRSRRVATVAAIDVYGHEDQRRWWSVQGYVFWVHAGPRDTEVASIDVIASLVRASKELPPPT